MVYDGTLRQNCKILKPYESVNMEEFLYGTVLVGMKKLMKRAGLHRLNILI